MFADIDYQFLKAQFRRFGIGVLVGSVAGMVIHLFARDRAFTSFLHREWAALPAKWHFDGFRAYRLELIAICVGLVLLLLVPAFHWLKAFARAWWAGIASLMLLAVTLAAFAVVTWGPTGPSVTAAAGTALVIGVFAAEWWRWLRPAPSSDRNLELGIPASKQSSSAEQRWKPSTSDDPITCWDQDAIGRTSVVELLADHALRQRTPIVALHGDLGDGKSSVLNLLKLAVAGQAIIVYFSAWLPGSDVTFATDLFGDIVTECRRYVRVPRLRKVVLAYSKAIGGSMPHLSGLKELLPTQSQRDDIQDLRETLRRLPRRILVLIDEVDRMQKDELRVLLKVLRGASTIPNVTFICAFSQKLVTDELNQSREYLEKFFPVSVSLSAPSPDLVGRLFQDRLAKELSDQQSFGANDHEAKFKKLLQQLWQEALVMLCTNLRQASILLSDIFTAARPIVGEVNPFDLVAIEAVRRFYPQVYSLVRANRPYLAYGSNTWAKYEYLPEEKITQGTEKFAVSVKQALAGADKAETAQVLLKWLFPYYENVGGDGRGTKYQNYIRPTNAEIANDEKRVCAADYFHIYFRGAVPEEMFSNAELEQVFSDLNGARSDAEVVRVFTAVLSSILPGHPKREDFLWKLNRASDRLSEAAAERLAYAASIRASDYAYDMMNIGEAAQALNLVFTAAQKLSATPKVQQLLEAAMARAADDTFALRILEFTEHSDRNKVLTNSSKIDAPAVRKAFIVRMERRYGPERAIQEIDIQQGDWQAFCLWAGNSPADREMEYAFWRRFIDRSRKRLAQACNFAFPKGVSWSGAYPAEAVSGVFPTVEFQQLLREIPEAEPLSDVEASAIDRMQRLVDGTWQGEGEFPGFNIS